MPDFTLEPEEADAGSARPTRMVSTGLAPTAEVPTTKTKERPVCYRACATCGHQVLLGQTRTGQQLALDVSHATYCVIWDNGAAWPRLEPSRGYPVHQCEGASGSPREGAPAEESRIPLGDLKNS